MERPIAFPHRLVNPSSLARPSGFSHAVVAGEGRTVYIAGQTAQSADGTVEGGSIVEQFDAAARNLLAALEATGGRPEHMVSMQIFVTDAQAYRDARKEIGAVYRRHFGSHYPAAALLEVKGLFDPKAKVELMAVAVIPDRDRGR
jgi:enamine deaminase RidA (YjgF/YER057c/UK114 family)